MKNTDNKEDRIKYILIRRILNVIHDNLKEKNHIAENCIKIPRLSMTIVPNIVYEINDEEESTVYIYYRIYSEKLDEPIFLTSTGNGKNLGQAIQRSVFVFLSTTMEVLLEVFHCNYPHLQKETLNVEIEKKKYIFDVYISDVIEYTGKGITGKVYNDEMWECMKEKLIEYLGRKKLYLVEIHGAQLYNGATLGEVSINNVLCKNLSDKIEQFMSKKEKIDEKYFGMLQQYQQCICVLRETKQYEPYPYTKEEIRGIVERTFELLKSKKEKPYAHYYDILLEEFHDKTLVTELLAFLPEICAQVNDMGVSFSEKIGILKRGETDVNWVYKTRITSYIWIEEMVAELYLQGNCDQSVFESFVSASATKKQIEEAGREENSFDFPIKPCIVVVGTDYEIR